MKQVGSRDDADNRNALDVVTLMRTMCSREASRSTVCTSCVMTSLMLRLLDALSALPLRAHQRSSFPNQISSSSVDLLFGVVASGHDTHSHRTPTGRQLKLLLQLRASSFASLLGHCAPDKQDSASRIPGYTPFHLALPIAAKNFYR
jgi:hypothetical protein